MWSVTKLLVAAAACVALQSVAAVAQSSSITTSSAAPPSTTTPTPTPSPTSTPVMHWWEVDVIFPRNETYDGAGTFPVVLAVQQPRAAALFGQYQIQWSIYTTNASDPSTVNGGNGTFVVDAASHVANPYILIATTDASGWFDNAKGTGPTLLEFYWTMSWKSDLVCGSLIPASPVLFSTDSTGAAADIMDVPECPKGAGSVLAANWNRLTPGTPCSQEMQRYRGPQPCDVKVDSALKSSISSVVSVSATVKTPSTTTTTAMAAATTSSGAYDIRASVAAVLVMVTVVETLGFAL